MNKLSISDFQILKKIGDGQFAKVFKAKEININKIVALKCLSNNLIVKRINEEIVKREIKIHSSLKHSNILRLFGTFDDGKMIYLILEYCERGEMRKDIFNCNGYPHKRAATYLYQLANALSYCHKNFIIHRDIKSENILLTSSGAIKLADFGCSKRLARELRNTFCGTLDYLSPEMLTGNNQTPMIDIWSLGVLFYEMLFLKNPFHINDSSVIIRDNIRAATYVIPSNIDYLAECFLLTVLRKDYLERLTAEQIINFPYVVKYAEKTLTECKTAIDQWKKVQERQVERPNFSFDIACPTFNFNTASQNPTSFNFEPRNKDEVLSFEIPNNSL